MYIEEVPEGKKGHKLGNSISMRLFAEELNP